MNNQQCITYDKLIWPTNLLRAVIHTQLKSAHNPSDFELFPVFTSFLNSGFQPISTSVIRLFTTCPFLLPTLEYFCYGYGYRIGYVEQRPKPCCPRACTEIGLHYVLACLRAACHYWSVRVLCFLARGTCISSSWSLLLMYDYMTLCKVMLLTLRGAKDWKAKRRFFPALKMSREYGRFLVKNTQWIISWFIPWCSVNFPLKSRLAATGCIEHRIQQLCSSYFISILDEDFNFLIM